MTKRPGGSLEHDVMSVLWTQARPLQPGEVQDLLGTRLAYTSVATVLGRLQAKGWVTRTASGRAFAYEAALDESQLAARRIGEVLASATDRSAVLVGFIDTLNQREANALKALLDGNRRR